MLKKRARKPIFSIFILGLDQMATCLRLYCPLLSQLGMCRAYRSSRGPRLSLKGILDILSRIWSSSCWHRVLEKQREEITRLKKMADHRLSPVIPVFFLLSSHFQANEQVLRQREAAQPRVRLFQPHSTFSMEP